MTTHLNIPPEVYEDHLEFLWPIFVYATQVARMEINPKDELEMGLIENLKYALSRYDKIWGINESVEESVQ